MNADNDDERTVPPLDIVEGTAAANDWLCERDDEELTILVAGERAEYQLNFTWIQEQELLHLSCAFDLVVPAFREEEMRKLVASINGTLWMGHFDVWKEDKVIMFRYGLPLAGGMEVSEAQCKMLIATALKACEQYYPAFHFIIWAGKSAEEAFQAVSFETKGEA